MKVIIIEDEPLAAEGLSIKLKKIDQNIEIVAILSTVNEAILFFSKHDEPDIAFLDIQLSDGLSFEIFEKVEVTCPIIFITAYDAYALQAFEVNSIDYLLKPVEIESLEKALKKLKTLQKSAPTAIDLNLIHNLIKSSYNKIFKTRFMTKVGDRLLSFNTEEIACFLAENKIVWMILNTGRKYSVDYKLEELQTLLDPNEFYKINRSVVSNIKSIKNVIVYSNSRLKIEINGLKDFKDVLISRENVEEFRTWFGK